MNDNKKENKRKEKKQAKREMRIATFDTNAIIYSIQNKIDILEKMRENVAGADFSIVIPSGIYDELEKIAFSSNSSLSEKKNANIASKIIKKWENEGKINMENASPPLDKWFITTAKKHKLSIITYDRKLRQYLKRLGAQIIMLRD
ncbi:MAG: hypothetical protein QXE90_00190 [Candidatus Micrarchaeia archaeon]